MEVSFDTDKRGGKAPITRIYAPSDKSYATLQLEADEDTPLRPQPEFYRQTEEEKAEKVRTPQKQKTPVYSYILLILSVFVIAITALLAINGNTKVASIYKNIYSVRDEIAEYEEKISMLKKEQSSLNDYATINNANQEAGRTMNWNESKMIPGN